MAIDEVRKSMWTPNGEVDLTQKDVIVVTDPMKRITFARLDQYARQDGLSLVCQRCDHAITGQNNDSSQVFAVACRCREWRFVK